MFVNALLVHEWFPIDIIQYLLQLFSRSTASGQTFYNARVQGLADVDDTIAFTHKMNDSFDLLSSRHPVEAV
jgi:hypothetical protein